MLFLCTFSLERKSTIPKASGQARMILRHIRAHTHD
jgi:hypothetical protein